MNKLRYVFDFDGVICNSMEECYFSAYSLYYRQSNYLFFKKFFKKHILYLKKLRVFVKSGLDYYVVIYILDQKLDVKNIISFIKIKNKFKFNKQKINKLFYLYRKKNLKKNYDLWMSLNPLYKGLKNLIKILINKKNLYILTYKDKTSVINILNKNKIKIPQKNIITVSHKKSKKYFFQKKYNYIFVEDNIFNLIDINFQNVKKYLAKWGYNSATQQSLAKKNKINVISILELGKIINKNVN